ncbi:MAG: hypothetical protein JWN15_4164 [Firmicutes bacterium]|nr:hypothetical protein [Bacillota bacterium]
MKEGLCIVKKAKPQVPEVRDPARDIAAAAQQSVEQAKHNALSHVTEDDLIWNDPETEVVKGNQYHSDLWVHGPANIELMASAYKMLLKTNKSLTNQVAKVRVARVRDTKYIIIKPTSPTDPNGIEVKQYQSSAWINAITVLGPAKLTVRTGYRERFVVENAPDDFPGAPCLLVHLGKRVERLFEGSKKAAGTNTGTVAKGVKGTGSAKGSAKQTEPTPAAPSIPATPAPDTEAHMLNVPLE